MAPQKGSTEQHDQKKQPPGDQPGANDATRATSKPSGIPKPESSSEYEGAPDRKPTGNPPIEVKTETSRSSGQ
jgi:hypothetical protein